MISYNKFIRKKKKKNGLIVLIQIISKVRGSWAITNVASAGWGSHRGTIRLQEHLSVHHSFLLGV